jgi:hypothetical protein
MKPRILVLYYTQSGQLRDILDSLLSKVQGEADYTYATIEPVIPFPFPWSAKTFFDAMPETVLERPSAVKPLPAAVIEAPYDLVIFGYQPWFLHPSQPVTAFLQSENSTFLKGKQVITVIGSRNMWLNAQEKVKGHLQRIGATLAGNIVLVDKNPNLISVITIIRWAFSGKKEATRFLPPAGVQAREVRAVASLGPIILNHLKNNNLPTLHSNLLRNGALELNTSLVLLEKRGMNNFGFWARYIAEKGAPGNPARYGRARLFKRLLLTGIFILTPISSLTAFIQRQIQKQNLQRDVAYFKELAYEPGKF